jgi:hypothetical protein
MGINNLSHPKPFNMPSREYAKEKLKRRKPKPKKTTDPYEVITDFFGPQHLPMAKEDLDDLFSALLQLDYRELPNGKIAYLNYLFSQLVILSKATDLVVKAYQQKKWPKY